MSRPYAVIREELVIKPAYIRIKFSKDLAKKVFGGDRGKIQNLMETTIITAARNFRSCGLPLTALDVERGIKNELALYHDIFTFNAFDITVQMN